jgi:hypothetical protein
VKHLSLRILITAILFLLGCWTLYHNWPQRSVRYQHYTYSQDEAHRLRVYPEAQYAYGIHAWRQQNPQRAAGFFRQAVLQDPLFLDAWLKLAESEADMRRNQNAGAILAFTTDMTDGVFRWKWSQMMLARELGRETVFYGSMNDLLQKTELQQDALQILHTHLDGDASAVVAVLDPVHLPAYLDWLMRWGLTDDSLAVWQALTAFGEPDGDTARRYAHFLVDRKRVDASADIWETVTGSTGLTNPGFEKDISGLGYDWRHWKEKDGYWALKRVSAQTAEGSHALRIEFKGRENLAFHHLYQIFTVDPREKYRLTYAWKSRGITTDQGPFVEVYGYDKEGLYRAGPMITGTHGWHEASIAFEDTRGQSRGGGASAPPHQHAFRRQNQGHPVDRRLPVGKNRDRCPDNDGPTHPFFLPA